MMNYVNNLTFNGLYNFFNLLFVSSISTYCLIVFSVVCVLFFLCYENICDLKSELNIDQDQLYLGLLCYRNFLGLNVNLESPRVFVESSKVEGYNNNCSAVIDLDKSCADYDDGYDNYIEDDLLVTNPLLDILTEKEIFVESLDFEENSLNSEEVLSYGEKLYEDLEKEVIIDEENVIEELTNAQDIKMESIENDSSFPSSVLEGVDIGQVLKRDGLAV